ncbi:acyl-CoA dehydrogenase/oxidase [Cantharellus anzutake]|uniref:acyl-CoA dehydrogenase/oxidase n=1 Tax=Cantharellus anzutake TaxID=1750568 RepID=UPI0019068A5E|nr:acyl-CoA dehydrogenase/oxidase [Cantharellus anzutake]KAF8338967.1 acyl-CoA dehydrogenase/oxidase [Cantharellus anzutake]
MKEFTLEQVAQHNKDGDLFIVVDAKVYNLSRFAGLHPGGKAVLLDDDVRGKDCTDLFYSLHRSEVLLRPQYGRLQVGVVKGKTEKLRPLPAGSLSPVPYGEPQWLVKPFKSPYYNESHLRLQREMRKLCDEVIIPEARRAEKAGERVSQEVLNELVKRNLIAMRFGPGSHLKGRKLFTDIDPSAYDYFHELIIHQEICRCGLRGFINGLSSGALIGLPPVLHFSNDKELGEKVTNEVFEGKKWLCLAISEAFAGSDVAGIKCTARKSEDGKFWIVNGTKKWITNGMFSDYFTKGFTMLLIPRGPGVSTTYIKTSYSSASGTAYVTFDNVRVPINHTLGEVDQGFKIIMSNFNHERWIVIVFCVQLMRNVVDETLKWASQRIVFGKPLIEQAVVRHKIAHMISGVESSQTWLEHITYQMNHMSYAEQAKHLAGPMALLKQNTTKFAQDIARDATQIFGGRAITQSGLGDLIEEFHRTTPFDAILGGAEDVMADLGVRQAQKFIPKNVRL